MMMIYNIIMSVCSMVLAIIITIMIVADVFDTHIRPIIYKLKYKYEMSTWGTIHTYDEQRKYEWEL